METWVWCWKSSARLIDLCSSFPTDTSDWTAYQLDSRLYYTMRAVLQHNSHYLGFVWREPANCITLISQAVFIQVITMPCTVVKRSICHLNSNDFSIFPLIGINLFCVCFSRKYNMLMILCQNKMQSCPGQLQISGGVFIRLSIIFLINRLFIQGNCIKERATAIASFEIACFCSTNSLNQKIFNL